MTNKLINMWRWVDWRSRDEAFTEIVGYFCNIETKMCYEIWLKILWNQKQIRFVLYFKRYFNQLVKDFFVIKPPCYTSDLVKWNCSKWESLVSPINLVFKCQHLLFASTYFWCMFQFCTFRKQQAVKGFLAFSGVINRLNRVGKTRSFDLVGKWGLRYCQYAFHVVSLNWRKVMILNGR